MGLNVIIDEFGVTDSSVKAYVKSAVESGLSDKISEVRNTLQTIAFANDFKLNRFGCVDAEAAADLLNEFKL